MKEEVRVYELGINVFDLGEGKVQLMVKIDDGVEMGNDGWLRLCFVEKGNDVF